MVRFRIHPEHSGPSLTSVGSPDKGPQSRPPVLGCSVRALEAQVEGELRGEGQPWGGSPCVSIFSPKRLSLLSPSGPCESTVGKDAGASHWKWGHGQSTHRFRWERKRVLGRVNSQCGGPIS